MIAYGIRWPSLAEDSEILRQRIARELGLRHLRRVLQQYLDRYESRAA